MFWKKSKDKDKSSGTSTTTVYRTDGDMTSAGRAITSFESKYKSSGNSSSSKTKITYSSKQTISQKQEFSSHITRTFKEIGPTTGGSALSSMDPSKKWTTTSTSGSINGSQTKQMTIFSRQKTEPSIVVKRIDATPFNPKYESPYRNANFPPVRAPLLPGSSSNSSVTTVTTTYQSPYRAKSSAATSSLRETKTAPKYVPGKSLSESSTTSGLFSLSPKPKTSIWNPMSSIENPKPTANPTFNRIIVSQPKITNPISSSGSTSLTSGGGVGTVGGVLPKASSSSSSIFGIRSPQTSSSVVKPSPALSSKITVPTVSPVNKKRLSPGVVHIFHNDKFDSPDKEFRIGSIEDVRLLKKTFQGFKMQVNLYENCTVKQVEDKVRKIELKDYANASCIVIVILTHGTRYETVAAKDGSYSIDDTVLFPILRNRSLRSKPKLLFIQACKGSMEPGKFHKDAIQPNGPPDEILKCYSTFEGYVAYRTEKGSLFIQSLCELLQEHGKTSNIKDIMDMVIRNVKIKSGNVQIPSYETTLTEPYVFGDYI